jgi:hypothetical protein
MLRVAFEDQARAFDVDFARGRPTNAMVFLFLVVEKQKFGVEIVNSGQKWGYFIGLL